MRNLNLWAEVIAALMWQPRTAAEIAAQLGVDRQRAYKYLAVLENNGVVFACDHAPGTDRKAGARVWKLQSKPFAEQSVSKRRGGAV